MEKLWRIIGVPLIVLGSFIALGLILEASNLPSADELLNLSKGYYEAYGYWVVLAAALIEGLLFINWYLPGSAVAVLGVVLAKESGSSVIFTLVIIMFSFFVTSIINYGLGRFGWYRLFLNFGLEKPLKKAHEQVERVGLPLMFMSSVHPNISALSATSAGVLSLNFFHFCLYSAAGVIFWGVLWGCIIYYFGSEILAMGTLRAMIMVVLVYIAYLVAQNFWTSRKVR